METNFIEAEKKCYNIKVPELKNIVLRNILHQKKEGICITAPKDNNKDVVSFEKLDHANSPNIPMDLIQEQNQMLNRPWNKLEKGLKINRVKDFIDRANEEWGLNKKNVTKLERLIISKIHRKVLSKKNDVNYDEEKGEIIDIPSLQFTRGDDNEIVSFRIVNKRTSASRSPGNKSLK
jgi:hypothetical protein